MKTEIVRYKDHYYTTVIINDVAYFIFSSGKDISWFNIKIYSSIQISVERAYQLFKIDLQRDKEYYSKKQNENEQI
jgi:hypothetical protein